MNEINDIKRWMKLSEAVSKMVTAVFIDERHFDEWDDESEDPDRSGWNELKAYTFDASFMVDGADNLACQMLYDDLLEGNIPHTSENVFVYFDDGNPMIVKGFGSRIPIRNDIVFLYPEV